MVMEFERGLASTRWTSNSPRPFARSPGAGVGEMNFAAAPADESGCVARGGFMQGGKCYYPANIYLSECVARGGVVRDGKCFIPGETAPDVDTRAAAKKWGIEIVQGAPATGVSNPVPAMLVQMRFTDRGGFALASQLDAQLEPALNKAGLKVSKEKRFVPVPVTWGRKTIGGDLYAPVVTAPDALAGIVYSGNAVTLPWTSAQAVDPKLLAALPSSLYVYTFIVTGDDWKFTDAQGAKAVSVIHDWMVAQAGSVYVSGKGVLTTVDKGLFPNNVVATIGFGLILVAALQSVITHVKTRA